MLSSNVDFEGRGRLGGRGTHADCQGHRLPTPQPLPPDTTASSLPTSREGLLGHVHQKPVKDSALGQDSSA